MSVKPRSVLLGILVAVGLIVGLVWLLGLSPAVVAQEILHPVSPGISMAVTVSNDTSVTAPSFSVIGPTQTIEVGALGAKQARTVQLDDPSYGDVALRDTATGADYVVLAKHESRSGVGGQLTVYWGDDLNRQSSGSVHAGPLRYSPRQWYTSEGVWPLADQVIGK